MSTLVVTNISDGTTSVPALVVTEGGIKAWAKFQQQTTSALQAGYNVTSYTDDGVGLASFTLTNTMADVLGGTTCQSREDNVDGAFAASNDSLSACSRFRSTSSVGMYCAVTGSVAMHDGDTNAWHATGDLA